MTTKTAATTSQVPTEYALAGNYPDTWEKVIGQSRAKRQLITAARSAKERGVSMPHTLIASGVPGIGKTTLALLCAHEMGCTVKIVSGVIKDTEARMIFSDLVDGDMLIIDEIHRMLTGGKANVAWMLHYIENGVLLGPLGIEECPKITIIGTSTHIGLFEDTILDRFPVQPVLVQYNSDEAAEIGAIMSHQIFAGRPLPSTDNFYAIAAAANNNPRLMRGLLENLRDVIVVEAPNHKDGDDYDLTSILEDAGLTADGLNDLAQRYLMVLAIEWRGEAAGAHALKERLREPGGLDTVERILMDKGLLAFTKRGRLLTPAGIKRVRELKGL